MESQSSIVTSIFFGVCFQVLGIVANRIESYTGVFYVYVCMFLCMDRYTSKNLKRMYITERFSCELQIGHEEVTLSHASFSLSRSLH
jgi:hypothetical protein